MNASGNIYVNCSTRRDKDGRAFDPSDYYDYEFNKAEDIPPVVMLGAVLNRETSFGKEAPPSSEDSSLKTTLLQTLPLSFQGPGVSG